MDFLELAEERYSCRKIAKKAVEREKIEKILKAAVLAPTAVNKQPFKIWVIESQEGLEKIKEVTPYHCNAPLVIAVGGEKEQAWVRPSDGRNFEDVDTAIVATHIMFEVQQLGLGTTWVGAFDEPKLKEFFPQMKDYDMTAIFPIGYPEETAKPSHLHTKRKDVSEVVEYI